MEELFAKVLEFLSSVEGASATVAIVLEFVFRIIPTAKPLSVLHIVADAIEGIGKICLKVASLLDKVLPQRLK